jgi:VWFA-related protein
VTKQLAALCLSASLLLASRSARGQDDPTHLKVQVVLVELDVAVTDPKGNYISGLKPENFQIIEDNLPEKITTFEEGIDRPRIVLNGGSKSSGNTDIEAAPTVGPVSSMASTSVSEAAGGDSFKRSESSIFILFDTSNYMYRGFVYAQDSIADFVRSLGGSNHMAFYSFSRDLSRITPLTQDRSRVIRGVRQTVNGDDPALYNSLLTTVKDAAPLSGRKAIVVFSNGPDTASVVPPEDISELAQSTGTIIYMISTRAAQSEPISSTVFERMTKATGGKVYFAKEWQDEKQAFASIREDLAHLYTLSYYPQFNPNRGFRRITVKLVGPGTQHYRIRTRQGYRLLHTSEKEGSETAQTVGTGSGVSTPQ